MRVQKYNLLPSPSKYFTDFFLTFFKIFP